MFDVLIIRYSVGRKSYFIVTSVVYYDVKINLNAYFVK